MFYKSTLKPNQKKKTKPCVSQYSKGQTQYIHQPVLELSICNFFLEEHPVPPHPGLKPLLTLHDLSSFSLLLFYKIR